MRSAPSVATRVFSAISRAYGRMSPTIRTAETTPLAACQRRPSSLPRTSRGSAARPANSMPSASTIPRNGSWVAMTAVCPASFSRRASPV